MSRADAPAVPPANAFAEPFLRRLEEEDEPPFAAAADLAGPWRVVRLGEERFAVVRRWEAPEAGDPPYAVFDSHHLALLAAAVLPALGREPEFRLGAEASAAGYPLTCGGRVSGHLRCFHDELAAALHLACSLVASPESLAALLSGAGATALRQTGRLLGQGGE
jgi:hypothetical protein